MPVDFHFIGGLICLAAVATLALAIHTKELRQADLALLEWIDARLPSQDSKLGRKLATAMRDLTALGGDLFSAVVLLVSSAVLIVRSDFDVLLHLVGIMIAARLAGLIVKTFMRRERPRFSVTALHTFTSSFPSIHTQMGFVSAYLLLTLVMLPDADNIQALFWAGGFSMLIGMTRLYFAVHWPSDVLAGWLLGLSVCLIARSAI